jgi:Asp/Glu/hydantoin racemase
MFSSYEEGERFIEKKQASYGQAIGILMQTDEIVRIPGDVGNANTFKFPVRYEIIPVVSDVLKDADRAIQHADAWITAAQKLEREGVRAITAGCGYTAILQPEISKAVDIPVFVSSLIQVPMVYSILGKKRKVGIITANAEALTEQYFKAVGWSTESIPVAITGFEKRDELKEFLRAASITPESKQRVDRAMAEMALDLIRANSDIGAFVLECTNLPPFAHALQRAVNLPVFDVVTLINWVFDAVVRKSYVGYL